MFFSLLQQIVQYCLKLVRQNNIPIVHRSRGKLKKCSNNYFKYSVCVQVRLCTLTSLKTIFFAKLETEEPVHAGATRRRPTLKLIQYLNIMYSRLMFSGSLLVRSKSKQKRHHPLSCADSTLIFQHVHHNRSVS